MLEKEQAANRYLMNILTKLKQFKDNDKLCDITINVNSKKFKAHKAILAAWSPKLANTILSLNGNEIILTVSYKNEEAFSEVLEYLYSGYITPEEMNVKSLIDIGKNLMIDSLVNVCEDYLKTSTSLVNFVSRYFTSLKYGLTSLEQYVVTFIETNILFVIEQEALLKLSPQDLKCFLTMGKMSRAKQEIKFTVIINWIGFDIVDRDKYLLSLLKNMTWNTSANDLLIQLSTMENIFTNNDFCLFQLLHSIVTATGVNIGPFMGTYPHLLSVYSHMVEALLEQDKHLISSVEVNMVDSIPISANVVKSIQISEKLIPEKKDAEVNTDVDSSYFMEESQTDDYIIMDQYVESSELGNDHNDSSLKVNDCNDSSLKVNDCNDSSLKVNDCNAGESIIYNLNSSNESDERTKIDCVRQNEKHRRKSKPRKISKNSETEHVTKEKKKRGRPKKNIKKVEEDIAEIKDDSVVIADDDENPDDQNLPNDSVVMNNIKIEEDIQLNGAVEVKVEKLDIDSSCSYIVDSRNTKSAVELRRYKSVKSRHDSINSRKKRRCTFSKSLGAKVNRNRKFTCTFENCDFRSRTEEGLNKHVESSHNIDVKLDCRKCDFSTSQMRLLCIHLKQHYTKLPYICDEEGCDQVFFRMGILVRHQMTHMNEKPYKCDQCAKSFATFNQLSCHKKLHEGRQFECDVCYKRFTTKGSMQTHKAIHFDNKPYLCDTCGFSTKHLSHLISHRKIHTGDVLRCTFRDCNYSTPKQGHMTQHINTHLNIRNHICQVCGKSFVVRGKLLRHERIHLKEKLFKCKQCDYQTSRTDRMKLHIESHGIKFKKRKYNLPSVEEERPQVDYHQLYEKVQASDQVDESIGENGYMTDMKIDALTLAASASMIVDNFSTVRLDQLGTASVASLEEMQAAAFHHYEGVDVVLG